MPNEDQPQPTGETAEVDTGQVAFELAMDMRRLLRARGEVPGEEPPCCDHCGVWTATHILFNRFLACDKPRCQQALEQTAEQASHPSGEDNWRDL